MLIPDYDAQEIQTNLKTEGMETIGGYPLTGFSSKVEAVNTEIVHRYACPTCGNRVKWQQWLKQSSDWYSAIGECPDEDRFDIRVRTRKRADGRIKVTRMIRPINE